jgi:hypothetical protein
MPVVEARKPVSKAVREGLQSGEAQWAFENSTPRCASRSRFGVFTPG